MCAPVAARTRRRALTRPLPAHAPCFLPARLSARHPCGAPQFTFYMYLSDVEDGGQTRFNNLGIEMQPRRGSAVLWPSVLDADPDLTDNRTFHEAVPPRSGQKLGANFWIHQHRFQEYHARGCDNKRYFHPHHRRTRRPVQADP